MLLGQAKAGTRAMHRHLVPVFVIRMPPSRFPKGGHRFRYPVRLIPTERFGRLDPNPYVCLPSYRTNFEVVCTQQKGGEILGNPNPPFWVSAKARMVERMNS